MAPHFGHVEGWLMKRSILRARATVSLSSSDSSSMPGAIGGRSRNDRDHAQSDLPEGDAPLLARNVLSAYFAAALIMPYAPFLNLPRLSL